MISYRQSDYEDFEVVDERNTRAEQPQIIMTIHPPNTEGDEITWKTRLDKVPDILRDTPNEDTIHSHLFERYVTHFKKYTGVAEFLVLEAKQAVHPNWTVIHSEIDTQGDDYQVTMTLGPMKKSSLSTRTADYEDFIDDEEISKSFINFSVYKDESEEGVIDYSWDFDTGGKMGQGETLREYHKRYATYQPNPDLSYGYSEEKVVQQHTDALTRAGFKFKPIALWDGSVYTARVTL